MVKGKRLCACISHFCDSLKDGEEGGASNDHVDCVETQHPDLFASTLPRVLLPREGRWKKVLPHILAQFLKTIAKVPFITRDLTD